MGKCRDKSILHIYSHHMQTVSCTVLYWCLCAGILFFNSHLFRHELVWKTLPRSLLPMDFRELFHSLDFAPLLLIFVILLEINICCLSHILRVLHIQSIQPKQVPLVKNINNNVPSLCISLSYIFHFSSLEWLFILFILQEHQQFRLIQ